jgi:hypothetical protein|tara:strand:- start:7 stop:516 length:510 start_codon:yes stop_codon:yes gene_type:complete
MIPKYSMEEYRWYLALAEAMPDTGIFALKVEQWINPIHPVGGMGVQWDKGVEIRGSSLHFTIKYEVWDVWGDPERERSLSEIQYFDLVLDISNEERSRRYVEAYINVLGRVLGSKNAYVLHEMFKGDWWRFSISGHPLDLKKADTVESFETALVCQSRLGRWLNPHPED